MAIPKGVQRRVQVQLNDTTGAAYTGAAPTVKVTKDGGSQATATNAATHKGGGQWELVLTATEMNADEVTAQFSAGSVVTAAVTVYPEGDYTPARAALLDDIDAPVSSAGGTNITLAVPPSRRRSGLP